MSYNYAFRSETRLESRRVANSLAYAKETYSIPCYVIQNRNLSTIHLNIIKSIMEQLNRVKTSDIRHMHYRKTAINLVQ